MARLCEYRVGRGEPLGGIFHRWGDDYTYGEGDEKIPVTVAIVENLDTGSVTTVAPVDITFFDRPDPLSPDHNEESQPLLVRLVEAER
jgi:hypothetical protein